MGTSASKPILTIGAGIAGITTALEAAEAGHEVLLAEREPSIGGRVLRAYHYFPKLCPPSCGLEINAGRLLRNPRIRLLTNTHVASAARNGNGWSVTLTTAPEYVTERCTSCGECSKVCKGRVNDPVNLGLNEVPAIRQYHPQAVPQRYVLDREACVEGCRDCVEACKYDAIDLDAKQTNETVNVGAVVLAHGWDPYPIDKLPELGGGKLPDVIANVHMERLMSPSGPTEGKILRPSNGEPPKKVAFVQCAGSRDVNHLPYCSAVCCLASLKQAIGVREQLPESEVTIFYIDRRTPGRNEEMLSQVAAMDGINLVKGKVGKVEQGENGLLHLHVEDVDAGQLLDNGADLVVLATGMVPRLGDDKKTFGLNGDGDGFGLDDADAHLFVAGVARRPEDVAASVRDATGAAAKAIVASMR
ncbi:MAG: NAD(P)-binding protein [Planctomycetota bacterium]|jgi:quinone-modifying oxidoreductase subunit QmoA